MRFEEGDIVRDYRGEIIRLDVNQLTDCDYEPVCVDIDWFSKQGFIVSIIDGISTYLIRYEDLMMTPTFDPETKEVVGFGVLSGTHYNEQTKSVVMDVVHFIKPVKYVHEVQHLLRVGEYNEFEESLKI